MNPELIPQLIAEIALADPRVRREDKVERRAQAKMWAGILAEVPYEFALQAAHQHYRTSQWPILPADIATRWHEQTSNRLGRHSDPIPDADPDDVAAWCRQLGETRQAVAQGRIEPSPHAVAAGPPSGIAALTAGIGRTMPKRNTHRPYIHDSAAAELTACLPQRAAREAGRKRGAVDLLSVDCPWCQAAIGQQCKRRSHKRGAWHRRDEPHPARVDAVVIEVAVCPTCQVTQGSPCRADDDRPYPGVHPQRIASALDSNDPAA